MKPEDQGGFIVAKENEPAIGCGSYSLIPERKFLLSSDPAKPDPYGVS